MRMTYGKIQAGVSVLALAMSGQVAHALDDLRVPPVDGQPAKVETIPQALVDALKAGSEATPASAASQPAAPAAKEKETEKPATTPARPQKPAKPSAPVVNKAPEKTETPAKAPEAKAAPAPSAKEAETKPAEIKPEAKALAPAAAQAAATGTKTPTQTVEVKQPAPAPEPKTEPKPEAKTEAKPATPAPVAKETVKETSFKEPGFQDAPAKPKAAAKPVKKVSPKAVSVDGTPVADDIAKTSAPATPVPIKSTAPAAAVAPAVATSDEQKPAAASPATDEPAKEAAAPVEVRQESGDEPKPEPKTPAKQEAKPVSPPAQPKAAAPDETKASDTKSADDYTVLRINGKEVKAQQIMRQAPNLSTLSGAKNWTDLNAPVQDEIAKALVQKSLLLEAADKAVPESDPDFQRAVQIAKDNARVQIYQQRYMAGKLDEKSLKNLYEERADAYASVTQATNFVHFLTPDEDLIRKVQDALTQGRSIASVSQAFAGSGLIVSEMPNLTRQDLPDHMREDVFALTTGKFSKPLKDEFGWHIFANKSKGRAKLQPMESVRPELEEQLAVRRWQEHLNELQKNAKVEYLGPDGSARKLP
jgi:hypothetical protein